MYALNWQSVSFIRRYYSSQSVVLVITLSPSQPVMKWWLKQSRHGGDVWVVVAMPGALVQVRMKLDISVSAVKCLYPSSWVNTVEDREPGKGKTFAVCANYNSKEEQTDPSSNQGHTPVFEGMSITACVYKLRLYACRWQSSHAPCRNSFASKFADLRTEYQHPNLPHFPLQIRTPLDQDVWEVKNTNSVFSGSSSVFHQWTEKCDCAERSGI